MPKSFWESIIDLPTTRNVRVWGQRPDKFGGRVQVTVEPSFRFGGHVFVAHNDHFNLLVVDEQPTTRQEAWSRDTEQSGHLEATSDKISIANEILISIWGNA